MQVRRESDIKAGTHYYMPLVQGDDYVTYFFIWQGNALDKIYLARGLVFTTKAEAAKIGRKWVRDLKVTLKEKYHVSK